MLNQIGEQRMWYTDSTLQTLQNFDHELRQSFQNGLCKFLLSSTEYPGPQLKNLLKSILTKNIILCFQSSESLSINKIF